MKKNYSERILAVIRPQEWVKFSDIANRLKLNSYSNTATHYYRGWLDLIAGGRLQESVDGTFRINQ